MQIPCSFLKRSVLWFLPIFPQLFLITRCLSDPPPATVVLSYLSRWPNNIPALGPLNQLFLLLVKSFLDFRGVLLLVFKYQIKCLSDISRPPSLKSSLDLLPCHPVLVVFSFIHLFTYLFLNVSDCLTIIQRRGGQWSLLSFV